MSFANLRVLRHRKNDLASLPPADLLVACRADAERQRAVSDGLRSAEHIVVADPAYQDEVGTPVSQVGTVLPDRAAIRELLSFLDLPPVVAVDLTGLMRDKVLLICDELIAAGVQTLRCFYAEPVKYAEDEETTFAKSLGATPMPVPGFANPLLSDASPTRDLLIVGVGYDRRQLRVVLEARAVRAFVYGLPSLQPGMYQESVLRAEDEGSDGFVRDDVRDRSYAAAHDPFEFADAVSELVSAHEAKVGPQFNLYLSPLGPKPQALGCGLFMRTIWKDRPGGVLLPTIESYAADHAQGVSRIWEYEVPADAWTSEWFG